MELTCPKCHGQMRNYERSGIVIDQCTECRGVFLDRGELDKLIDAEAAQQQAVTPPAARTAPAQSPPWGTPQPGEYDDRYRDDRYRDDKYRDDKHRDDRYRDDRYRGDDDHRYGKKRKRSFLDDLFD